MSAAGAEIKSVNSEFDIFALRPIQMSLLGTIESAYKSIDHVDQNYLVFFIPANNDTLIVPDIKLFFRDKLISASGKDVDYTDLTCVTNKFFVSLFSQCNFNLNGVTYTQASEHYI